MKTIWVSQMANLIVPAPVCWPLCFQGETVTSDHVSASCYRRGEDVGMGAVVVAELKLRDVQRRILCADFAERASRAARRKFVTGDRTTP